MVILKHERSVIAVRVVIIGGSRHGKEETVCVCITIIISKIRIYLMMTTMMRSH